jgi:GAF domain-containing protein
MDAGAVGQRIADSARVVAEAAVAALYLVDPASGALGILAVSGEPGAVFAAMAVYPPAHSVVDRAVRTARAAATIDVLGDPGIPLPSGMAHRPAATGHRALVSVPLVVDSAVIGALAVGDVVGRLFPRERVRVLELFAEQAAVALQSAGDRRHERERLRRTEAALAVTRAASATLDLGEILGRTLHEMARALGADVGGVWVLRGDREALTPIAGLRAAAEAAFTPRELSGDDPLLERVRRARGPVLGRRPDPEVDRWLAAHVSLRALVVQPTWSGGELTGCFALGWMHEEPRVTVDDLRLLDVLAREVASVVEQGNLHHAGPRRTGRPDPRSPGSGGLGGEQVVFEADWTVAGSDRHGRPRRDLRGGGKLVAGEGLADDVGWRIVDGARSLLGAAHATLVEVQDPSRALRAVAVSGEEVFPLGPGLSGFALRERQPVVIADLLDDPRITMAPQVRAHLEQAPVRAVLSVPLLVGDEVIGTLSVGDRAGRVFEHDEVRLLQAFAGHAALAVQSARLRDEIRRRQRDDAALDRVTREITAAPGRDDLHERIVTGARQLCPDADLTFLAACEPGAERAAVVAAAGAGHEAVRRLQLVAGRGRIGRVLESGEPFIADESTGALALAEGPPDDRGPAGLHLLAAMPLRRGGVPVGVLGVAGLVARHLSPPAIRSLARLADHAAIALESHRGRGESRGGRPERARVATELHDALSPMLFSVGLKLDWCLRRLGDASDLRPEMEEIKRETGVMMTRLRELIGEEDRVPGSDGVLHDRLRRLVEAFRELTGIPVGLSGDPGCARLAARQQDALYRMCQEALANIAKHARATCATIRIESTDRDALFEVTDDGIGPPEEPGPTLDRVAGRFGLRQAREAIEAVGGWVRFGRAAPSGFRLWGGLSLPEPPGQ